LFCFRSNYLLERNSFEEIKTLYSQSSSDSHKPPDILVLQLGHITCVLPYNGTLADGHVFVQNTEENVKTFFKQLKEFLPTTGANTTVVISLTSRAFLDWGSDHCTWRLNRIIAYEAHKYGFIVLEREEIETRLLSRHEKAPEPIKSPKALLAFPGVQIVAASLITLLNCLEQNLCFSL
jgi:hypothetical protein